MLRLSSLGEAIARMDGAREISVEAYTLHGPVLAALEAAARHGTHVVVELERQPYDDPKGGFAAENARLAAELRGAGADATLADPVHAKTISIDGTLYLDEKNWHRDDIVICEDDAARAGAIPMTKSAALAAEARLLAEARATDGAIVETESLGFGNAAYAALAALGRAGVAPRLLVCDQDLHANARERSALRALIRDGVQVRICKDSAKLALAGERAWLGSANATYAGGRWEMPDWGLATANSQIVGAVRARLEADWSQGKPLSGTVSR